MIILFFNLYSSRLECSSSCPSSLHFYLFFKFPFLCSFSTDSPIDHSYHWFIVSCSHSFIEWIFQWYIIKCQYWVLIHVCAHTHMYICVCVCIIFSNTDILNVWHRKCKDEKNRLFSTLLLSISFHSSAIFTLVYIMLTQVLWNDSLIFCLYFIYSVFCSVPGISDTKYSAIFFGSRLTRFSQPLGESALFRWI